MSTDDLADYTIERGYNLEHVELPYCKAVTIKNRKYHIFLDKHLSNLTEKELLAHELGHCETGCTYTEDATREYIGRCEYRANKWAYNQLMPPCEIKEAISNGMTTVWELAEYFDVSCEFMQKALEYYLTQE